MVMTPAPTPTQHIIARHRHRHHRCSGQNGSSGGAVAGLPRSGSITGGGESVHIGSGVTRGRRLPVRQGVEGFLSNPAVAFSKNEPHIIDAYSELEEAGGAALLSSTLSATGGSYVPRGLEVGGAEAGAGAAVCTSRPRPREGSWSPTRSGAGSGLGACSNSLEHLEARQELLNRRLSVLLEK